jgi:hypothetical protein
MCRLNVMAFRRQVSAQARWMLADSTSATVTLWKLLLSLGTE